MHKHLSTNCLTCWPRSTRYLVLLQYCIVEMNKLTRTLHNCGQWLPSVHINFNAAYIGAALYQICARLINCTAFNVLMHASSKKDVHFFISNSRHDINFSDMNITLHSGPVCNSATCNSGIQHASQDTAAL